MSLTCLVEISNEYGKNPELVLAGGGNTSYKDDDLLYIKGSGTTLATIKETDFVKMNRKKLSEILTKEYDNDVKRREALVLEDLMAAREKGEEGKRPSVETSLHDILPFSYVVHLHPALVNGLTCSKGGRKRAEEIFGKKIIWIDNVEPGYVLAKKVLEEYKKFKNENGFDGQIIFLQNHGVFVAANTADEIDKIYTEIMEKLKGELVEDIDFSGIEFDEERAVSLAPAIRMFLMEETSIVTFFNNKTLSKFLKDSKVFKPLSSSYTPDHIVYCKANPLFVEKDENLEKDIIAYREKYGYNPRIIAVKNLGVFAHGKSKKEADTAKNLFLDTVKIATYTKSFGGHSFMPQSLIDFIIGWEAESYRSKVGMKTTPFRASEKIAIVTGSAQGFGQGIAEELLKEGTNVVIADLNGDLAKENALEMEKLYGKGKVLAITVDVGSEDSTKNMINKTVLQYGGIDVYINNAGIVKAGSLEEITPETLELVSRVNYTAYFLGTKYSSRIMKIQHKYRPDYFMDIIQINSKSGLVGSNKNFAYAGSKFGGIGLTQSFALELTEFNIKVNSICPGNFLDGPLWTDPEKGLFVQYLKAGKIPGAKTIEDVKRSYESKVPMNRGCRVIDVVRAIFYCMEQEYETGQAIPVTGGQNMLK